jgi:hypothetical protein
MCEFQQWLWSSGLMESLTALACIVLTERFIGCYPGAPLVAQRFGKSIMKVSLLKERFYEGYVLE